MKIRGTNDSGVYFKMKSQKVEPMPLPKTRRICNSISFIVFAPIIKLFMIVRYERLVFDDDNNSSLQAFETNIYMWHHLA